MQMGIVGLPNVGKSTLFNVLTKMGIPAENYPFCTIQPNQVRVQHGHDLGSHASWNGYVIYQPAASLQSLPAMGL